MKISLNDKTGIDLDKLIESRLLVQANSGGGKSWAIRRIIEQSFGRVQIIVIDPEGEFGNMRGAFDFVYVGKGGDAPAESRSAALLAHRLLETKASAIIDLYELHPQERKHFVRLFCEAMVNAPKELWHDVLTIIDEAHVFAPEKSDSEALGPVIDLATRGRKRGYCVVLATQRLPKLNKDAAAECNNKLIGRASQDIDRKRAAEELGFTTREQILSLRDLEPGEFYAFGPAISREVEKIQVGGVRVKPAKRGSAKQKPPAPSSAVKKILAQFRDLPKEAEEEAKTVADLKKKIRDLEHKRRNDIADDPNVLAHAVEKAVKANDTRHAKRLAGYQGQIQREVRNVFEKLRLAEVGFMEIIKGASQGIDWSVPDLEKVEVIKYYDKPKDEHKIMLPPTDPDVEAKLGGGELRLLKILIDRRPMKMTRSQLALLAGVKSTTGTFKNYLSKLRTAAMLLEDGELLYSSDAANREYGDGNSTAPDDFAGLISMWNKALPAGPQRIFKVICEHHPNSIPREMIASSLGISHTTGTFKNYLSILRTNNLIKESSVGVELSEEMSGF